ncbi:MAG: DUF4167 domain-containing protein [Paracoccaceae bacterium]
MRPAQKNNRARGRGNRKGGGGGGNNLNRVYESAGPEGKVRGTPQQIVDKYLSLARDAQTAGDRVMGENFLQHAEHYQRILLDAMGAQAERREASQPSEDDDEGDRGQVNGQAAHVNGEARDRDDDEGDDTGGEGRKRGRSRRGRGASGKGDDQRGDDAPEARGGGDEDDQGEERAPSTPSPSADQGAAPSNGHGIGGFDTIDTDDGASGDLLVATEENARSQPRRRRTTRRKAEGGDEAGGDAKPESGGGAESQNGGDA